MKSSGSTSRAAHAVSRTFARWFPTPALIFPRSVGIDISDSSVKWLVLVPFGKRYRVETFGEERISPGVVVNGIVKDAEVLGQTLKDIKKRIGGINCAHAALPEETAYVFETQVREGASRGEILHMIEFEFEGRVPIAPSAAVFDFDVIQNSDGAPGGVAVTVFPREVAESYVAAFSAGGMSLLSLEIEARSIARAVSSGSPDEPVTLLVDFGRARTGFAVLKRGIPIFTSTVSVGGDEINRVLMEKSSLSSEEARVFRNEQGLRTQTGARSLSFTALEGAVAVLGDEITRHYHYWDTRRNEHGDRMTPVERVVLIGGNANLMGLTDYIAGRVQAPTVIGDVWQHVCDLNEYIPPINRPDSLQYATAIGLALRSL